MKTDLLEVVQARIESYGYAVSRKRLDSFTGKEGIVLLPVQSRVVSEDYSGCREIDQPYRVVVRKISEAQAMDECEDIAQRLAAETLESADGSYRFVDGRVYVEPRELKLDENNMYAWHVTMAARITIERWQ